MIPSDTHCWVEGATLAIAFFHCGALMIAGGEIVLPRCLSADAAPSALNSAVMMHNLNMPAICSAFPCLAAKSKPPTRTRDSQLKAPACSVSAQCGDLFPPLWLIDFDAKPRTKFYTEVPLQCNTSSCIIIKIPPALQYKLNLINHFLYDKLTGSHKFLNFFSFFFFFYLFHITGTGLQGWWLTAHFSTFLQLNGYNVSCLLQGWTMKPMRKYRKRQLAEWSLKAGFKSESVPTRAHVKMPSLINLIKSSYSLSSHC